MKLDMLPLLSGARQPSWETALTMLINDLAAWGGSGILVLDDLHAVETPQIHEQLAFLVDYLPPSLHLVVVTPGAGRRVGNVEFLALSEHTPRFNLSIITMAPGRHGPPPHVHEDEDDA